MIEEPYRWVEAIANRREYIETQLDPGSPIVALSYEEGILLFTAGGAQQKLFEIYDRIGLGAIGHPGDVERLRLMAIEQASTEGFTRSASDVSLRRLGYFSLSPVMKTAFEQIYGPPFLARLLFVELGETAAEDLFLRLEFDGSITPSALPTGKSNFAVLTGTLVSAERMQSYLTSLPRRSLNLSTALEVAADACAVGRMANFDPEAKVIPASIADFRRQQATERPVEAAVLERNSGSTLCYRPLAPAR